MAADLTQDYSKFRDINLEKTVIGAIINQPELVGLIAEDLFYLGRHKTIFLKIKELDAEGKKVDLPILASLLSGKVEAAYISSCLDGVQKFSVEAFESYVARLADLRSKRVIWTLAHQVQKSVDAGDMDKVVDHANEILQEQSGAGKSVELSTSDIIRSFEEYTRRGEGIKIGFPTVDNLTGGFSEGEVLYLVGRAKVAKSLWAQNVISNFVGAYPNDGALFFSMEMPDPQVAERLLQIDTGLSKENIRMLTAEQKMNIAAKYKNVSYITRAGLSVSDIFANIIQLKYKKNIRLVVIDFLTRIKTKCRDEYDFIRETTKIMKDMAKQLGVFLIILSQTGRQDGGYGYLPLNLQSARGSGTIEEDGDFVFGVFRPELNPDIKEPDKTRWKDIVVLQMLGSRRTERIERIECIFNKTNCRIYETLQGGIYGKELGRND